MVSTVRGKTPAYDINRIKKGEEYFHRACSYEASGEPNKALKEFQKSCDFGYEPALSLANISRIYLKSGAADQSEEALCRAREMGLSEIDYNIASARLNMKRGLYEAALRSLLLIQKEKSDHVVYKDRAHCLIKLERYDEALAILKEALKKAPDCCECLNETGDAYLCTGNIEAAFDFYRRALALNPAEAHTRLRLLTILQSRCEDEEALALIKEGLKITADDRDLLLALSDLYLRLKDTASAESVLSEVREKFAADDHVRIRSAKIDLLNKDTESAKQLLSKCDDSDEKLVILADILELEGDFLSAAELQTSVSDPFRFDPGLLTRAADNFLEAGEYSKAIPLYKTLVENCASENRFLFNRYLNSQEIAERKTVIASKPQAMTVSLTSECVLSCMMCYVKKEKWKLPQNVAAELKSFFPYLRIISWYGGEPFLYEGFSDLFDAAASYPELAQCITTNGLLIDNSWISRFKDTDLTVEFSVDSVRPVLYEKIRKGSDFNKLMENIKKVSTAKAAARRLKTQLNVVVMRSNHDQLQELYDFALSNGFDYIRFSPVNTVPGPENIFLHRNTDMLDRIKKSLEDITAGSEHIKVKHTIPFNFNRKNGVSGNQEVTSASGGIERTACLWPWRFIDIRSTGAVSLHSRCNFTVGNVTEDTIQTIWNSRSAVLTRKYMQEKPLELSCWNDCITAGFSARELGYRGEPR